MKTTRPVLIVSLALAAAALTNCGLNSEASAVKTESPIATLNADPDLLAEAVGQTDESRWTRHVRALSGRLPVNLSTGETVTITSRHSSTDSNTWASQYIFDELEALGYDVEFQTFNAPTGVERNVIATLPGQARGDEVIVMGAHYDSTAPSAGDAPGADDNASGVATLLEAAAILQNYSMDRTLQLVAFGSEEQGLIGSTAYVQQAVDDRMKIKGAVVCDMVGWYDRKFAVLVEGGFRYASWMNVAVNAAANFSAVDTRRSWYSFGSDHVPFQNAGIPAFLIIEQEWHSAPHYHSSNDTFDVVDPEFGNEVAKIVVGALGDATGLNDRRPVANATRSVERPSRSAAAPIEIRDHLSFSSPEYSCRLHGEHVERGGI